jgi:nitroreductase
MDFKELLQKRRSVRAYTNQPVPDDKINRILEAARLAPTASNRQSFKLIVVKDPTNRRALMEAAGQPHVGQAPLIIAAVATNTGPVMPCEVPMYPVDLGIVIEHLVLAAADEGLGSCWIGAFSQDKARKALGVPDKYKVVTFLPVGYPAGETAPRAKKPIDEIVNYEKFSE